MNYWQKVGQYLKAKSASKYALPLLFIISLTESCCFVIPPEVMLLPMIIVQRKRAALFTLVTIVASVAGAILGYYGGIFLGDIFCNYFSHIIVNFAKYYQLVSAWYQQNATITLLVAGFTPIPYKVFTLLSGIFSSTIPLSLVVTTAIISRGARYSLLAALLYWVSGERGIIFIKKYFAYLTILITLVIAVVVKLFTLYL